MTARYPDIVFDDNIPEVKSWARALEAKAPEISYDYWPSESLNPNNVRVFATFLPKKGTVKPLKHLELIVSLARGVDGLLADDSIPQHVPIVKMTDTTLTGQVTEYIIAAITSHHLRLNEYKNLSRSRKWDPLSICVPRRITVGFLGAGKIGMNAATKVRSLGFETLIWSRKKKRTNSDISSFFGEDSLYEMAAQWSRQKKEKSADICSFFGEDGLYEMVSQSNILVCTLPLTIETRNILNASLLKALPEKSYIINVSRGECLSDRHLINEINKGHISGAMLDVFHEEPLPASHDFWEMDEVTITPHIAGYTVPEERIGSILEVIANYKNGKIDNLVNRKDGY